MALAQPLHLIGVMAAGASFAFQVRLSKISSESQSRGSNTPPPVKGVRITLRASGRG
jgi:hypothetical protein